MIRVILVSLAFMASPVYADSIKSDKVTHLGVSFALGIAAGNQWPNNKPLAFGVAMIPGLLKEVSDRGTTGFSGKDMAANAIGAALGVTTAHWLISRHGGVTVLAYRAEF